MSRSMPVKLFIRSPSEFGLCKMRSTAEARLGDRLESGSFAEKDLKTHMLVASLPKSCFTFEHTHTHVGEKSALDHCNGVGTATWPFPERGSRPPQAHFRLLRGNRGALCPSGVTETPRQDPQKKVRQDGNRPREGKQKRYLRRGWVVWRSGRSSEGQTIFLFSPLGVFLVEPWRLSSKGPVLPKMCVWAFFGLIL